MDNLDCLKAEAALVDATIIISAARPRQTIEEKSREIKQSADPDATWVKKGNKSYFGYRAYAIADGERGFYPAFFSKTCQ